MHAASARVARAVYRDDPQEEADARRALAVVKIDIAIARALAVAPPLTPAQVERLSGLLRAGGAR